jgi:hypothetical protein
MSKKTPEIQKMTKPDEKSGVHVEGHIKIFDPESKEVFVSKRS